MANGSKRRRNMSRRSKKVGRLVLTVLLFGTFLGLGLFLILGVMLERPKEKYISIPMELNPHYRSGMASAHGGGGE